MLDFKTSVIGAALLAATAVFPLSAQTPPASDNTASASHVSDETLVRTGAALKKVISIKNVYGPKVGAAGTPDERTRLNQEANAAVTKAISDQGLTVDEYRQTIELAQSDPDLQRRLVKIVGNGD